MIHLLALFSMSFFLAMGKKDNQEIQFCTMDVMTCPDGSFVARDPEKNCDFRPCPPLAACPEDTKLCSDGTSLSPDPKKDCAFPKCPSEKN